MRKRVSKSEMLKVALSSKEVADLRDHTLLDPKYIAAGVVDENGNTGYDWSLEEFEDILGYIAASANHCANRRLEKRLDAIYSRLDAIFGASEGESI